jgi:toxin ParE1/3/4
MMKKLIISGLAREDLDQIWDYLAEKNEDAAIKVLTDIHKRFQIIVDHPEVGKCRDDLLLGMRSYQAGAYIIFYFHSGERIELFRVLHGARNIPEVFDDLVN